MKSRVIICTIVAASFSVASLSFAQGYDRRRTADHRAASSAAPWAGTAHDSGPRDRGDQRDHARQPQRPDQFTAPRRFERHEARSDWKYGARGPQFHRGGRIPPEYRNRQYVVNDWRDHHLNQPPRGHQWVQVGADYVLVAIATGVIVQLLLNQ